MSRRRKALIGVGVVVLLGVLVFRALQADRGNRVEVRAEVVGERDLVARVTASGHIEPKRSVQVQSDISGRIVELPVEEGQEVEEGQLLLVIDPTQYRAALRQAEARLAEARSREAQARADFRQAEWEWERIRTLKERAPDLVTEQEVEQVRTQADARRAQWEAAQHAVSQAEAAVEEAQDRLEKTVIRAPMSGRITRLAVEQGETAIVGTMNNPGTVLLTIADLSVMEAVVEVDETDVTQVQAGDSASVEIDAFPDRSFPGRVTKIGNSSIRPVTQQSPGQDEAVDFEVRVTLDAPPEGIRPDLSSTADIITARRQGTLAIPIIALTLRDTTALEPGWRDRLPPGAGAAAGEELEGVFVIRGEKVEFHPVEVGVAGDAYFEVRSGLAAGDTVVAGSYQAIRDLDDGGRVQITALDGEPGGQAAADTDDGGEGPQDTSASEDGNGREER